MRLNLLSKAEKTLLVKDLENKLGKKLEMVGSFRKKMILLSLLNSKTGRQYALSAGLCVSENNKKLSQIEIEYIAKRADGTKADSDIAEIEKELKSIQLYLTSKYKGCLEPTRLTKFNWLVNCVGFQ